MHTFVSVQVRLHGHKYAWQLEAIAGMMIVCRTLIVCSGKHPSRYMVEKRETMCALIVKPASSDSVMID